MHDGLLKKKRTPNKLTIIKCKFIMLNYMLTSNSSDGAISLKNYATGLLVLNRINIVIIGEWVNNLNPKEVFFFFFE